LNIAVTILALIAMAVIGICALLIALLIGLVKSILFVLSLLFGEWGKRVAKSWNEWRQ
jgi:hypothetical protein